MKCPRCSIGAISPHTNECVVCGFVPVGGVLTETAWADLDETTRRAIETYARPLGVLRRTHRSLVCFAEERETDQPVLLKVLLPSPDHAAQVADRFERELSAAAAFASPLIIPIRRFGTSQAACWYSMEQAPGQTVDELMQKTGTLEVPQTLRIAQQVASALDYIHRRGTTHGNLKPSNILVDPRGGVRVADCGIARVWGLTPPARAETAPDDALAYLAAEYFASHGVVGPGTDQYALAALVFEALVGGPPFRGVSFDDVALAHRTAPPPSLAALRPEVPAAVSKALQRALAKDPAHRFPSVVEFARALTGPPPREPSSRPNLAMALPVSHQQILFIEPAPSPPPGPRFPWLKAGLGAGAVVVAALVFGIRSGPQPLPEVAVDPPPPQDLVAELAGEPPDSLDPARRGARPEANVGVLPRRHVSAPVPPPPAPARLSVSSTPWAELAIDGILVGNTPKIDVFLSPGLHRIDLTRDGFQPYTSVIRLSPGQSLRLTGIALQAAQ